MESTLFRCGKFCPTSSIYSSNFLNAQYNMRPRVPQQQCIQSWEYLEGSKILLTLFCCWIHPTFVNYFFFSSDRNILVFNLRKTKNNMGIQIFNFKFISLLRQQVMATHCHKTKKNFKCWAKQRMHFNHTWYYLTLTAYCVLSCVTNTTTTWLPITFTHTHIHPRKAGS